MYRHIRVKHQVNENLRQEQGMVFLTFSISALAIFILVGLAIDSANLYMARLNVQSAADAAALSGLGQVVVQKPVANALKSARYTARANLVANKIAENRFRWREDSNDPALTGVTAAYVDGIMNVRIDYDVPLYLMSGLPGMRNALTKRVSALGRARIRKSNVALVLDTSNSMSCPSAPPEGDSACPCLGRRPEDGGDCNQGAGSKIYALKAAAKQFVENFEPQDGLSVTAYSHGAELVEEFRPPNRNHDRSRIQDAIDGLSAEGATNLADGIFTAYMDAKDKSRTEDLFFVVFSDGAPTAGRFHFTRSAVDPDIDDRENDVRNNVTNGWPAWADYDWFNWGLIVVDDVGVNRTIPNRMYLTPPPTRDFRLSGYRGERGFNGYWNKRTMSAVDPPRPPGIIVAASSSHRSQRSLDDPAMAFRGGPGANERLLRKMEVYMPGGQSIVQLGRRQLWSADCPNGFCWDRWIKESESFWIYTDLAIHMADAIRQQDKAIFFTIGYGGAAGQNLPVNGQSGISCAPGDDNTPNVNCSDPYQGETHANWRKDITNRRIALSLCGFNDPPFFGKDLLPLQELLRRDVKLHGESYSSDTPENLKSAFDRIARRIKMRRASNF